MVNRMAGLARSALLRLWISVLVVVIYGLAIYAIAWLPEGSGMILISGALLLSMGIGSLLVALYDPLAQKPWSDSMWLAFGILALSCLIAVVFLHEGVICLIMAGPILMVGLILGVALAYGTIRWWRNRRGAMTVVALPLLVLPLEMQIDWPDYRGSVSTEVIIAAPPEVVWANTVEIRDIDPETLRFTISHDLMFFPRPLDARLDRHGVGATRSLKWTSGVHFREIVTEWDENRRLGWSFEFDPESIPPEIDSHLRPDREESELLRGEYVLEPLTDGRTKLVLTTYYQVSLPWNSYGRFWADRLLTDFHTTVLDVIEQRAEAEAASLPSAPQT